MNNAISTLTLALALCLFGGMAAANPGLVLSEIHYHPVEEPEFNEDGSSVMDLYDDVHEFLEIHNAGPQIMDLDRWHLTGDVDFVFPPKTLLKPGDFLAIARAPDRLAGVSAYGLSPTRVLGPYLGLLGNRQGTVRLRNPEGTVIDSVSYSSASPWAICADALGAGPDFTGLNNTNYQYRGRSLERVSFLQSANDPANWVASPLSGNPSPGKPNSLRLDVPLPVVLQFDVTQASDQSTLIRSNQPVRVQALFSARQPLSSLQVEWFVEDMDRTNEVHSFVAMTEVGPAEDARFEATLPGLTNRALVRFRFLATRGSVDGVVSPRADDPFEWHAYFVTPVRTSLRPIYDVLVAARSLTRLDQNITGDPRRVTRPDPPGTPRASWNATEPAFFIHEGVVYDMRMRYHGSRYNRNSGRQSYKFQFPRYRLFGGKQGVFETDKGDDFINGHGIFAAVGLPTSRVRYVDLYVNRAGALQRLEQDEMDERLLDRYYRDRALQFPGTEVEPSGEIYKSTGVIDNFGSNAEGEGPYSVGDERKLGPFAGWSSLERYFWTYTIQSAEWKGSYFVKQMIDGLWAARGDTHKVPNPNVPATRTYLEQTFDIDKSLTYLATLNWMCPWDDTSQNHFIWQQRNAKWGMLPWDFDAMFGNGDTAPSTASIYMGEYRDPNNNFRGPNWLKDSFFKAYREEYKQRIWLLNHTVLHPNNIRAMGFTVTSHANTRFASINSQVKLGPFNRPTTPVGLFPTNGQSVAFEQQLQASPYGHTTNTLPRHASTTWVIRSADGSYAAPAFFLVSTNDLTSLPLPYAALKFGGAYFWRCQYTDINGHPSFWSDEASFAFGVGRAKLPLISIDSGTLWKYFQDASGPIGAWKQPEFDDSAWASGPPLLGADTNTLIQPIRTPLTIGTPTYYFRNRFILPTDTEGALLRLRFIVDDALIVYLNGSELMRTGLAAGLIFHTNFATRNVSRVTNEGPFLVSSAGLVPGENVLAVEVHNGRNSPDVSFGLGLEAEVFQRPPGVTLSEIAARNGGSVTHAGNTSDWIELYNPTSETVDLAGMALSDDPLVPTQFIFPPNTTLPPQSYMVVWCDSAFDAAGLHTGFALNSTGQSVGLFARGDAGWFVQDSVTFGPQATDFTLGRLAGEFGRWQLCTPTPARENSAAELGNPAALRINEWLSDGEQAEDWFELYNTGTLPVSLSDLCLTEDFSRPNQFRIARRAFLGPKDFLRIIADENTGAGADHVSFRLRGARSGIGVYLPDGKTALDQIHLTPQRSYIPAGRFPDGESRITSFPTTPTPGESNYLPIAAPVINEVLNASGTPLEDAIELYNPGGEAVDITGWYLSDNASDLKKYRFPANSILPPRGFLVVYEEQLDAAGSNPTDFVLSATRGEDLWLSAAAADGTLNGYRSHVVFGASERNVSLGRHISSTGEDFVALNLTTFGADQPANVRAFRTGTGKPNAYAKVGPLVVSEFLYQPPPSGAMEPTFLEFVELLNPTGIAVPLFDPAQSTNTWRLEGDIQFQFPPAVTLRPGTVLVLVPFHPSQDAARLQAFQAAYSPPMDAVLLGPYQGQLRNRRGTLSLVKPLAGRPDESPTPYLQVEVIHYSPGGNWPAAAAGSGASLRRISPLAYANDPRNWIASRPSPGTAPAVDSDGDGISNLWELTHQLDPNSAADAGLDSDGDGQTNLEEFLGNTDPGNALDVLRLEIDRTGDRVSLRFLAKENQNYLLQFRTLPEEGEWITLQAIPGEPTTRIVESLDTATEVRRIYRVTTVFSP